MKKNFVPQEPRFSLFPDELVVNIMSYAPLNRAHQLLYQNGEMDSQIAQLEVNLYQEAAKRPALYIGYLKDNKACVESFPDSDEGGKRVAELKETDNDLEIVVVDGLATKP